MGEEKGDGVGSVAEFIPKSEDGKKEMQMAAGQNPFPHHTYRGFIVPTVLCAVKG